MMANLNDAYNFLLENKDFFIDYFHAVSAEQRSRYFDIDRRKGIEDIVKHCRFELGFIAYTFNNQNRNGFRDYLDKNGNVQEAILKLKEHYSQAIETWCAEHRFEARGNLNDLKESHNKRLQRKLFNQIHEKLNSRCREIRSLHNGHYLSSTVL